MFIIESREGSEPQRYEFNHKLITLSHAALIESLYKKLPGGEDTAIEQIRLNAMTQGGANAVRVLLWAAKNAIHATLRIEDVDPLLGEVEVKPTTGEVEDLRAGVLANKAFTDQQRDLMLGQLDALAVDARESEVDAAGKAPSPSSDDATG